MSKAKQSVRYVSCSCVIHFAEIVWARNYMPFCIATGFDPGPRWINECTLTALTQNRCRTSLYIPSYANGTLKKTSVDSDNDCVVCVPARDSMWIRFGIEFRIQGPEPRTIEDILSTIE